MSVRYGDGNDSVWIATQAISGTTPIVSKVIDLRDLNQVAMQMVTTGTVAGTWLIEGSNDFTPTNSGTPGASFSNIDVYGEAASTGTFTDITTCFVSAAAGTAVVQPAGSASNKPAYNKDPIGFRCIRVTFTPSSGSGNCTLLGFGKGWA